MIGNTNARIKKGEAQLYDTKILSTQSAEKGWAYNNANSYRSFSSSTLPTLFNDISIKLAHREGAGINSQLTTIPNPSADIGRGVDDEILFCNGTYFCAGYYYNTSTGNWTPIANEIISGDGEHQAGGNIIFSFTDKTNNTLFLFGLDSVVYKVDTNTKNWKSLGIITDIYDFSSSPPSKIQVKEYNNIIYVFTTFINTTNYGKIYAFDTSYSSNSFNIYDFGWNIYLHDILYANGYFYIVNYDTEGMIEPDSNLEIYKGTSLANTDITDTTKWAVLVNQKAGTFFPHDYQVDEYGGDRLYNIRLDYKDNKIWCFSPMGREYQEEYDDGYDSYTYPVIYNRIGSFYTTDDFVTKSSVVFAPLDDNFDFTSYESNFCFITDDYIITFCNNTGFDSEAWDWVFLNAILTYCNRSNLSESNTIIFDFKTMPSLPTKSKICLSAMDRTDINNSYIYDGIMGTGIYSDQYIINNTTVTIEYSKYNNFKICTYSSLTTLNSLYTQYGYSVYWNLYGNQVSIPMNAQNYSVLYVGDDYVDSV